MVNLGGHRVHLHCEGAGSPMVVLIHRTPRFSFHFALVQAAVGDFTRVCAYDRAGDAWSDPVPGQPTARIFLDELDRVVRHVSPRRPVILAGHSVGGVLARAYYGVHPERVAAMVLIDTAPLSAQMLEVTDEQLLARASEAAKKPRPAFPKAAIAPPFDKLPPRFQQAHLWATEKWQAYAAGVDTFQALKYQADLYKMAAKATSDGLPVWFLTRAEKPEGTEPWVETQQRMAADWRRGKLVRIAPSGHDIQLDQPAAVGAAIREAVDLARANAK
jgi:pimeloyl-ACP methyl ester carboxylesterase